MRTRDSTYISKLEVPLDCFDCHNTADNIMMKETPSKLKVFRATLKIAIFCDYFRTKIIFMERESVVYWYSI
jgi:hypothetical protein